MRTIWKFPIPTKSPDFGTGYRFEMEAPDVCLPRDLQAVDGDVFLWAEVDTDAPTRKNRMIVMGTGRELPPDAFMYIGSWRDGDFVWHLYHCYDEDGTFRRGMMARRAGVAA